MASLAKKRPQYPAHDKQKYDIKHDEQQHTPTRPKAIGADENPTQAMLRRLLNRWRQRLSLHNILVQDAS